MSKFNCVRLDGRIARIGDGRYLPSGDMAIDIRIAVNEPGRKAEFFTVDLIGEPADVLQNQAVVGQEICLECRLGYSKREGFPPALKLSIDRSDGCFRLGNRPSARPAAQAA